MSLNPRETPGAILTTYHSARLYLDEIPRDHFDMLILDEAHKLRDLYGVDPIPKVAKKFRRALISDSIVAKPVGCTMVL